MSYLYIYTYRSHKECKSGCFDNLIINTNKQEFIRDGLTYNLIAFGSSYSGDFFSLFSSDYFYERIIIIIYFVVLIISMNYDTVFFIVEVFISGLVDRKEKNDVLMG